MSSAVSATPRMTRHISGNWMIDREHWFILEQPGSKVYRLYDPKACKVIVSRDVVFDEHKSWNWNKQGKAVSNEEETLAFPSYGAEEPPLEEKEQRNASDVGNGGEQDGDNECELEDVCS